MSSAQTWLQTQMEGEGLTIVYSRGTTELQPFLANPDQPAEAGLSSQGQVITFGQRDWAFALSNLATLSPPRPKAGDRITTVIGTETHLWTVQPDSQGPAFDDLDVRRGRIAAHTVYQGVI